MNARGTTYMMLEGICLHGTYSSLLLRKRLSQTKLQDKGLIMQIVCGTLQNYRLCCYQWEDYVKKLPGDEVCVLLNMSVCQLFYMDRLPAYAIISDTVEIMKKQIHGNMAELANAVPHAVQRREKREITGKEKEAPAVRTSHPTWLVQMWKAQYDWDNARKVCEADMETKPNAARVNT